MTGSHTNKRRGRPPGSGLDDSAAIQVIAVAIAGNPKLKPTTVFMAHDPEANSATVRRIQSKWKASGTRLLFEARSKIERARAAKSNFPSSVARGPVSVTLQQQIDAAVRASAVASADYESATMRAAYEMTASSVARAISDMQDSPAIRAMRDLIDSPAARAMRELQDSPTMRAIRAFQDSPAMRAMREHNESPVAQRAREMLLRHHEVIERARRVSGLF